MYNNYLFSNEKVYIDPYSDNIKTGEGFLYYFLIYRFIRRIRRNYRKSKAWKFRKAPLTCISYCLYHILQMMMMVLFFTLICIGIAFVLSLGVSRKKSSSNYPYRDTKKYRHVVKEGVLFTTHEYHER